MIDDKPKRFQFSLLTLMLVISGFCVVFAFLKIHGPMWPGLLMWFVPTLMLLVAWWISGPLRVFALGFVAGFGFDFAMHSIMLDSILDSVLLSGNSLPWYPFSSLFLCWWLMTHSNPPYSSMMVHTMPLLAIDFGLTLSGLLGGIAALITWYQLGVHRLGGLLGRMLPFPRKKHP